MWLTDLVWNLLLYFMAVIKTDLIYRLWVVKCYRHTMVKMLLGEEGMTGIPGWCVSGKGWHIPH